MKKPIGARFAAILVLMGCVAAHADEPDVTGSTWTITALDGKAIGGDRTAEINFIDDRVSATVGCNRMGAGYVLTGDAIRFTAMMSTKMMCSPRLMKSEQALSEALATAVRLDIDGEALSLFNRWGRSVLTAQRNR